MNPGPSTNACPRLTSCSYPKPCFYGFWFGHGFRHGLLYIHLFASAGSHLLDSPSSLLSLHFGFKNYLLITSVISAFLTVGFPMLIRQNYTFGIVSRIFLGSLHSGWFPGSISHSNQGLTKLVVCPYGVGLNHWKRYKVHGEHGHPKRKNAS